MILSGHQPNYLPGTQLFNKIALSDVFMHCGHLQYKRKSWHSHNYIRTGKLVVPIFHDELKQTIDETRIDYSQRWQRRHVKSIGQAYGDFPYFWAYFPKLRSIIEEPFKSLGALDRYLTEEICAWLDIKTRIVRSCRPDGDAIGKIVAMCEAVGANHYLSNEGARLVHHRAGPEIGEAMPEPVVTGYIGPEEEARMKEAGVTHLWQDFTPPWYGQGIESNGGHLSVIDLLFRYGPEAGKIVHQSGRISRPGDGV